LAFTPGRGRGAPYNSLYKEALAQRIPFLGFQVYKRVGTAQPEVYEKIGKSEHLDSCHIMN